jgi:short-subunit dehydrogenase
MGEAVAALLAAHKVHVVVVARNGVSSAPARLIQAGLASPGSADLVASQAAGILGGLEQGSGAIVHVCSLQWKRPHESSPAYGAGRPPAGTWSTTP